MDSSQIEHELEDLEGRLERLRSLYEQYFLGMEKVEPMVLRKDVDRRLWVLRREQIRNTGLRFKFQMLIQRYNTYQQYWTRVVREIENGTYRRDVIKVAQRFGEKAAITIAGKRRAEQYKRLAQNQLDRRKRRNAAQTDAEAEAADAAATRPSMPDITVEEEEAISLSGADIELIEDDSDLSSVPLRAVPPVRPDPFAAHAASEKVTGPEPDIEALLQLATVGVTTWSRPEPPRAESSPPLAPSLRAPRLAPAPAPRAKSPSERPAPRSKRPSTKPPRSRPSTKPPPRAKSLPPPRRPPPPLLAPRATASPSSPPRCAQRSPPAPKPDELDLDRLLDPRRAPPRRSPSPRARDTYEARRTRDRDTYEARHRPRYYEAFRTHRREAPERTRTRAHKTASRARPPPPRSLRARPPPPRPQSRASRAHPPRPPRQKNRAPLSRSPRAPPPPSPRAPPRPRPQRAARTSAIRRSARSTRSTLAPSAPRTSPPPASPSTSSPPASAPRPTSSRPPTLRARSSSRSSRKTARPPSAPS
ncbi:MAG: hypothetical protein R3B70_38330 [Polyangiaceae bacterium]